MKHTRIILALIVVVVGIRIFVTRREEGVSGESMVIGQSFVLAEYGYARGNDRLLYAIVRTFPTNSSKEQRLQDARYSDTSSGVSVRDNDGRMIPVGRDGMVYLYDGDHLRTMKVKVSEHDVSIMNCKGINDVWAQFQRFEVHTNN